MVGVVVVVGVAVVVAITLPRNQIGGTVEIIGQTLVLGLVGLVVFGLAVWVAVGILNSALDGMFK